MPPPASLPADNFFDASGYIQDVRGSVTRLHQEVAALRSQVQSEATAKWSNVEIE